MRPILYVLVMCCSCAACGCRAVDQVFWRGLEAACASYVESYPKPQPQK